jgi:hypothetical protein
MALLLSWLPVALAVEEPFPPCGTPALLEHARASYAPFPEPAPPFGGAKTRDPYGFASSYETEHFVVRWGEWNGFDQHDIEALAARFEVAWAVEVGEMGYPNTSTPAKLNVYIGGSGGPALPYGEGPYTWVDDEGYPMVVLHAGGFVYPLYLDVFAPHELFHTFQLALRPFGFEELWYWEATAHWSVKEVVPDDVGYAYFLASLLYFPERSIDTWYADATDATGYPQYAASLFIRSLTEHIADRELVYRSWTVGAPQDDALLLLDALLAEQGTGVEDAFFDFAARNATWDYLDRATILAWEDSFAEDLDIEPARPSGVVTGATEGWVEATEALPQTYGANYWKLEALPVRGEVVLVADPGPRWWAAIVQGTGEAFRSLPLEWDGDRGALVFEDLDPNEETWLVVAAIDTTDGDGTGWGYRFEVAASEETTDTGEPDTEDAPLEHPDEEAAPEEQPVERASGCGCGSPGGVGSVWLALLAIGACRRSRRTGTATAIS